MYTRSVFKCLKSENDKMPHIYSIEANTEKRPCLDVNELLRREASNANRRVCFVNTSDLEENST